MGFTQLIIMIYQCPNTGTWGSTHRLGWHKRLYLIITWKVA